MCFGGPSPNAMHTKRLKTPRLLPDLLYFLINDREGRLWSVRVAFLVAHTSSRIKMEEDTSPSSTTRPRRRRHVPARSRPPPSAQGLWVLLQGICCVCLFLGPWQWTIVGAFVLPSMSHINPERRRTYTTPTAATSHKHVLLKAAAASGPGYIHNPDKRSASSSSKRRGNGGRSPAPPPPPPSHVAAAPSTTSPGASSLVVSGGKKEEWHRTFEHLQGLTVRHLSDYDAAFSVCRAAQRPFECLSLLRYMSRDKLPRKPQWYEATARLAAEMENWVTALDTYILFERKEEVCRTSALCVCEDHDGLGLYRDKGIEPKNFANSLPLPTPSSYSWTPPAQPRVICSS